MPAYRLMYFNGRGVAEVSRQLFALAGLEYEDARIERDEWPKLKSGTPFGKMPVLFVDGNPLPQSFAIARYLAREFGFAGKNSFEAAWVDALADQFKDYYLEFHKYFVALMGHGDKDALRKTIGEPVRDKHFTFFEGILKDNHSGYLVGDSITWVDLMVAEDVYMLNEKVPGFLDEFPKINVHSKMIRSTPRLKEYIENRPKTIF